MSKDAQVDEIANDDKKLEEKVKEMVGDYMNYMQYVQLND